MDKPTIFVFGVDPTHEGVKKTVNGLVADYKERKMRVFSKIMALSTDDETQKKKIAISSEEIQEIQKFANTDDSPHQKEIGLYLVGNAMTPNAEALARFINELGISPQKICVVSCFFGAPYSSAINNFLETLSIEPKPVVAAYPDPVDFDEKSGKRSFFGSRTIKKLFNRRQLNSYKTYFYFDKDLNRWEEGDKWVYSDKKTQPRDNPQFIQRKLARLLDVKTTEIIIKKPPPNLNGRVLYAGAEHTYMVSEEVFNKHNGAKSKKGKIDVFRTPINQSTIDDGQSTHSESILWAAAHEGNHETIKVLVDAIPLADHAARERLLDAKNDNESALWTAAHQGHYETVRVLVDAILKLPDHAAQERLLDAKNHNRSALSTAAREGHHETAKVLVDAILTLPDPAAQERLLRAKNGDESALWTAACEGHHETAKVLVDGILALPDPGVQERLLDAKYGNQSALWTAALKGHRETVKVLVDATFRLPDPAAWERLLDGKIHNRSALCAAAREGRHETAKVLVDAILALPNPASRERMLEAKYNNESALWAAALEGHHETAKVLVDGILALPDPAAQERLLDAKNDSLQPALWTAAYAGHSETAKVLVDAILALPDPVAQERLLDAKYNNQSALSLAAQNGHYTLVSQYVDAILKSSLSAKAKRTLIIARTRNGISNKSLVTILNENGQHALAKQIENTIKHLTNEMSKQTPKLKNRMLSCFSRKR